MVEKLEKILANSGDKNFLLDLIKYGRRSFENSIEFIDFLTQSIKDNPILKEKLIEHLHPIFRNINMIKFLTDFKVFSDDKFVDLFFKQIGYKILPQISDDQSLLSLVSEVLYSTANHNFVKIIPLDRWLNFYEALFATNSRVCNKEYVKKQIRQASIILMDRIIGGAADTEVLKMTHIQNIEENPFQKFARNLIETLQDHDEFNKEKIEILSREIMICQIYLDNLIDQKDTKGISLKITIKITRLRQQLDRISVLLKALYLLDTNTTSYAMASITKNWLNFYSPKSNVTNSFQSTLYVWTSLITWHNRQIGEKYITSTKKEYLKMLYSALGGGCIVAFLCFIKLQMGMGYHTPFGQALLYSLNYSWGFVAIYLLHWTLATKQPAMTAAALAHTLKQDDKSSNDYKEFGLFFSRLFRSQFIAFMGNVLAVFIVGIFIYYLLHYFTSFHLIDFKKASSFKNELENLDYKIFWYGAIAGVFLFASGLVSGLTENYTRYNNVPERMYNHPFLKSFFKDTKRRKLVDWYKKNIGGISGNVFFGFCLGFAFLIGNFLGIPFDIRHITFAAGNYAIALCYFGFDISFKELFLGFVGIFGIGAFNFLISFSLSLLVAMKSVNVPIREIGKILYSALKLFMKKPTIFFFPTK